MDKLDLDGIKQRCTSANLPICVSLCVCVWKATQSKCKCMCMCMGFIKLLQANEYWVQFNVWNTITWTDRCVSWLCALFSICDDSGLCLVDDEVVESIKWTVAVLIFNAASVAAGAELHWFRFATFFVCGEFFFCSPINCASSFFSCPSMVDASDDDGDDNVGDAIVDDGDFVWSSVDWLMQTFDVDGTIIGSAWFSTWISSSMWWLWR